jgi:hypothetical protein
MVRCPSLFGPGVSVTIYERDLLGLIPKENGRIKETERSERNRKLSMVAGLDIFDAFLPSTVTDQNPPELS